MSNKDRKPNKFNKKFNNANRNSIGADIVKAKEKSSANDYYSNLNSDNKSSISFNKKDSAISIKFDRNNPCAVRGMKILEIFILFTIIVNDSLNYGEYVADEVRSKVVCPVGHGAIAPLAYLEKNHAIMPAHLANAGAGNNAGNNANAGAGNNAGNNANAGAGNNAGNNANANAGAGNNAGNNANANAGTGNNAGRRRRGANAGGGAAANAVNAANAGGGNVGMNVGVNAGFTPQQLAEEKAYENDKLTVQKAYTSERVAYLTHLADFKAFVLKNRVSTEILTKLRKVAGFSTVCGQGSNAVRFIEWFQDSLFTVLGKEERELEAEYKALLEGGFMIKHCDGDALLYIEYVEDIIQRYNQLQVDREVSGLPDTLTEAEVESRVGEIMVRVSDATDRSKSFGDALFRELFQFGLTVPDYKAKYTTLRQGRNIRDNDSPYDSIAEMLSSVDDSINRMYNDGHVPRKRMRMSDVDATGSAGVKDVKGVVINSLASGKEAPSCTFCIQVGRKEAAKTHTIETCFHYSDPKKRKRMEDDYKKKTKAHKEAAETKKQNELQSKVLLAVTSILGSASAAPSGPVSQSAAALMQHPVHGSLPPVSGVPILTTGVSQPTVPHGFYYVGPQGTIPYGLLPPGSGRQH